MRGLFLAMVIGAFVVSFDGCFYYPDRQICYTPAALGLPNYEEVFFEAADGVRLWGWFIPALREPRGTVIHFHGNAENMSTHVTFSCWLPEEGYNLFTFDYRGYGKSAGRPTRAGTVRDGHAALDYVLSRPDVDKKRVHFLGQSLGGAVATVVAAERPEVCSVVLDSTFSSYRRIGAMHLRRSFGIPLGGDMVANMGLSGGYEPIDFVARISPRPLLVISSGADKICFPELGRELFDAAQEPKEYWLVEGAFHTGALVQHPDEARPRIAGWFDRAGDAAAPRGGP